MKPHDEIQVLVNQGWRTGICLAVKDRQALIEYTMPAGSSALQVLTLNSDGDPQGDQQHRGKAVQYLGLSTAWLEAIVERGVGYWRGLPQRGMHQRGGIPQPGLLLLARRDGRLDDDGGQS